MVHKIEKKIVGQRVITPEDREKEALEKEAVELESMHEGIERPDRLFGSTYKIKPGGYDHALYITINDYKLNEGTDHEQLIPYEIFLNSKAMESFQWIVGLTRVISAVFRKGGDATFLIDELGSVFDPKGGYWKKIKNKPSIYMPSVVADIGEVLKIHLIHIGLIKEEEMDDHQKAFLEAKKADIKAHDADHDDDSDFPAHATLCSKCNHKSVVIMDGCKTCLNCGQSHCG